MHDEPAFVALGFKSNRRGGWWFREPSNAIHNSDCAVGGERTTGLVLLALLALVI